MRIIVIIMLITLTCGCKKSETIIDENVTLPSQFKKELFVGNWVIDSVSVARLDTLPNISIYSKSSLIYSSNGYSKLSDFSNFSLHLKDDNSYSLNDIDGIQSKGNWSQIDQSVTLRLEQSDGSNIEHYSIESATRNRLSLYLTIPTNSPSEDLYQRWSKRLGPSVSKLLYNKPFAVIVILKHQL